MGTYEVIGLDTENIAAIALLSTLLRYSVLIFQYSYGLFKDQVRSGEVVIDTDGYFV